MTIIGLTKFLKEFADYKINYQFSQDPEFLSVQVLDPMTKTTVINEISLSNSSLKDKIVSAIEKPYTEQQRQNLSTYLELFAKRRSLSLDIFPNNMLEWLDIKK